MSEVKPCVCPWCDMIDKVAPIVEGSRTLWCERCGDCGLAHEWKRIRIAKLKFAAMELLKLAELPQVRRSEDAMEKISDRHDELEAEIDYWNTRTESEG